MSAIALALCAGSVSAGTIAVTVSGNSDLVNGLLNTHDVGIYTAAGTLSVSVTVPGGTVAPLDTIYRMFR